LLAAKISLWFNVLLFIFKLAAVLIVPSLAIATDFSITVVGLTVSVLLYKSLKLSSKPADLLHNYGYGKVENVCEALEGIVLIGIALLMSIQATGAFFKPHHVQYPWVGFGSSVMSLSFNFIGAFFLFRLARISHSPAVKAEAVHYTLEGFISSAIACAFLVTIWLAGTAFAFAGPYVDPVVTLVVSMAISVPSIRLAKSAFTNLLDASIEEPSKLEAVVRLAQNAELYCNFEELRSRNVGHKKLIELKLILPRRLSFEESHEIAAKIQHDIKSGIRHSEVTTLAVPCAENCSFLKNGEKCPYLEFARKELRKG